jgi:tryptophanyl-tRNA synthetase
LEKVKYLKEKWCNQIFIIIADVQWMADKIWKEHWELVKKTTYDYARWIINCLWEDITIFRESKVRKDIAYLTDIIQDYIHINDLKVYNKQWPTEKFLINRIQDQINKWKNPSISNIITAYTWQSTHIIGAKATLVPSWADEFSKTAIAACVIQKLNSNFNIKFKIPIAIWSEEMLLWFDGKRMSTNFGNYISTKDTNKEIEKKIAIMDNKTLKYYCDHYGLSNISRKDLKKKLEEIVISINKAITTNKIEDIMIEWEKSYKESIESTIKQIMYY